jgi:ABC-type sugar transport system ATPase subunit
MRFEISKLRKNLDSTFVYVTHDQIEAMTLADRIVVFNEGHIQQLGTPMDLYNTPSNLFVAGFIGSPQINSFEGKLEGTIFKHELFSFDIGRTLSNKEIIFAIRSEHIDITNDDKYDIEGEVTLVETLGNETILWIENSLYDFKVRLNTPDHTIKNGDKLKFNFQKENIHIFNKETEERI